MIKGDENMAPFKYDVVGSFLRPDYLKEARKQYKNNSLSKEALKDIEDKAIKELVEKEIEIGLQAVTDGEFRRAYWHLDFLDGLAGVEEVSTEHWSKEFKKIQDEPSTLNVLGKVDFTEDHPFIEHFRYLKSIAGDHLCKLTIPSPTMIHLICCMREEKYVPIDIYQNMDDLYYDIAMAYQKAIRTFYNEGCRYLQFDDTAWGELCDKSRRKVYSERGFDIDQVQEDYVKMINLALEAKPDDMIITMHICRGNFRSQWFFNGGYTPIAKSVFAHCHVDGFFLEYDSERAGDFKPLRYINGQKVVLGLVTSKFPELEDKDAIKARIIEASQYVPLDHLCLSPQCGFSSTDEGNVLTEDDQWNKIKLIKEISKEVWGA